MASTPQEIPDFKDIIDKTWKSNMKPIELITYTSEMIEKILLLNCREETDETNNHYGCPLKVTGYVIENEDITDKISCIKEYIIEKYKSDNEEK